ncbi:MAG TPA: hypothetical protein VFH69_05245, partial [Gemmatimonadota bacterium]|nr:hypothetical protein [Gemmatimonadota bacterium]
MIAVAEGGHGRVNLGPAHEPGNAAHEGRADYRTGRMVPEQKPLRIAIGGRMQVGKTTAADRLVERHGFVKYALATPIKEIARSEFGWDGRKDPRGRRLLQEI